MTDSRRVTRKEQRPLSDDEAAVFEEWFGPASDGVSVAVRRAIRDGLYALPEPPPSEDVDAARLAAALREHADRGEPPCASCIKAARLGGE